MLYFRIGYNLDYYCSKPFRFTFNDNSRKIVLIDSYATRSVTLDYDDIKQVESFKYKITAETLHVFAVCCKNNEVIFFIDNANLFKKIISDGFTEKDVSTSSMTHTAFERILSAAILPDDMFVIRSSTSNFDQHRDRIQAIIAENN